MITTLSIFPHHLGVSVAIHNITSCLSKMLQRFNTNSNKIYNFGLKKNQLKEGRIKFFKNFYFTFYAKVFGQGTFFLIVKLVF